MAFEAKEVLPGVYHIRDCMGVCMTLLAGEKRALLVDTGYGIEDTAAFVKTLTELPLTVVLTHAHHDHALGAMHFERTAMFSEDLPDLAVYTSEKQRRAVLASAHQKGIAADDDAFLAGVVRKPEPLSEGEIDLGGLTARILHVPGHTPGSAVVLVKERALLLTGDDWNPCTWLFFPAALGAREYRANVRGVAGLPFEWVLCSHQPGLYPRSAFDAFLAHLKDENLRSAPPVDIHPYEAIDTRQADMGDGQIFVFDWQKAGL